jgi:hypothetical protein
MLTRKTMNLGYWRAGGWAALVISVLGLVVLVVLAVAAPERGGTPLCARAASIFVGGAICGLVAVAAVKITERLEVAVADAVRMGATQQDLNDAGKGVVRALPRR